MELLLFIYALECGIMRETETTQEITYVYAEAEAGFRMNDAFLIASLYGTSDPYMEELDGLKLSVSLFVDHDGYGFGIVYDYDLFTEDTAVKIYGRVQSWE
jgi:hypothetical protein